MTIFLQKWFHSIMVWLLARFLLQKHHKTPEYAAVFLDLLTSVAANESFSHTYLENGPF